MRHTDRFVKKVVIERIGDQRVLAEEEDVVIKEERISLYLNGTKLMSMMSLPSDQDAHAVGFLMSEGVIEKIEDLKSVQISSDGSSVYVEALINHENITNLFKEKTLTSGCCVGVTGNLEGNVLRKFIATPMQISLERIWEGMEEFEMSSHLFHETGCVHKASLLLEDGSKITAEDIGRHNAIDKVMGKARLGRIDTEKAVLVVSGRLSMEMVVKVVMHNIPMIVSRAAATFLGIKTAQELGVTLVGFARGEKMNIYTHSGRVDLRACKRKRGVTLHAPNQSSSLLR